MQRAQSKVQVRERLVALLNEVAGISPDLVTDTATVDNELRMKSIAFVELQVAIEDEYNIQVDPLHLVELNEFGLIVEYVYQSAEEAE